jgi:hypothetical protein
MDIVEELNTKTAAAICEVYRVPSRLNADIVTTILDRYFIHRLKQLSDHAERVKE